MEKPHQKKKKNKINKQSRDFIKQLFNEVWTKADPSKLDTFYHKDMTGVIGNQRIRYDDIVHRIAYIKSTYSKMSYSIEDIITEGDNIAIRIKQILQPNKSGVTEIYHLMGIYSLYNEKIQSLVALVDKPINYFEAA